MYRKTDFYDAMIDAMISFAKIRKERMNDSKRSTKYNLKNLNETDFHKLDEKLTYKWINE